MKYTVLFLYPENKLGDPLETYLAHVDYDTVEEAIDGARIQAWGDSEGIFDEEEFEVLAVFAGHLIDLKGGA